MDIENILYSLIPLILIIVFSWLFSFLGSRMKKQAEQGASSSAGRQESSVMDLLTGGKSEDYLFGSEHTAADQVGQAQRLDSADWKTYRDQQAPKVSSKPIKPKWWGA